MSERAGMTGRAEGGGSIYAKASAHAYNRLPYAVTPLKEQERRFLWLRQYARRANSDHEGRSCRGTALPAAFVTGKITRDELYTTCEGIWVFDQKYFQENFDSRVLKPKLQEWLPVVILWCHASTRLTVCFGIFVGVWRTCVAYHSSAPNV